jgi:NTE family protein
VPDPTRVSLALGSGGARGYAHIGAIQVIEERGWEVVSIAGSSMGALVGAVHAAGALPEYTDWALGLTQLEVLRLLDLSLASPGAIRAERVLARVQELIGGRLIEDLPIPFTAVATDLVARREVWFQRGPVELAVRASIALPGIFSPVMHNGRLLVDGGLLNPIPIAPTVAVASDLTVAISLGGGRGSRVGDSAAQETAEPRPAEEWMERFRRGAAHALDTDLARSLLTRFAAAGDGPPAVVEAVAENVLPAGLSKFDVMNQSLDAMQEAVARYRLAGFPPDLLITVPKDACRTLDFHRAGAMIELGRRLTTEALEGAGIA